MPLLACRLRHAGPPRPARAERPAIGPWQRSWTDAAYGAAVAAAREAIARGDVYQVNIVQHLSAPITGDPAGLAAALAPLTPRLPAPFAGTGYTIVSASPELFIARRGRRLVTAPIKGTAPRGRSVYGAKDAAEHVMIVDLMRNDLGRVCEYSSITAAPPRTEAHAGVWHLVSTVSGKLRAGVDDG